jgi:hypothetical protein
MTHTEIAYPGEECINRRANVETEVEDEDSVRQETAVDSSFLDPLGSGDSARKGRHCVWRSKKFYC